LLVARARTAGLQPSFGELRTAGDVAKCVLDTPIPAGSRCNVVDAFARPIRVVDGSTGVDVLLQVPDQTPDSSSRNPLTQVASFAAAVPSIERSLASQHLYKPRQNSFASASAKLVSGIGPVARPAPEPQPADVINVAKDTNTCASDRTTVFKRSCAEKQIRRRLTFTRRRRGPA
jgi:hypothetical protein